MTKHPNTRARPFQKHVWTGGSLLTIAIGDNSILDAGNTATAS